MVSVAYYRAEAERCRALAAGTNDPEAALRWNRIANDYEALAEAVSAPGAKASASTVLHVPMQQQAQPVQQQQSKKHDPTD